MKFNQCISSILVLTISCHSPTSKPAPVSPKAFDTTKAISRPEDHPENASAVVMKTHLRDTIYTAGNFILFLRPDEARYAELEKDAEGEVVEADADFGVGIGATQDSLKRNDLYKHIRLLITTNRYIFIKDCKDGPLVIDRDSVNYGFILSAKGRSIAETYRSVHSGDYLGELDEYFSLR